MQPDFKRFQVEICSECLTMTQCAFIVLLKSFLSSPASKQKKIIAVNFDVKTCKCYAKEAVIPCIVGPNSLEYKEAMFNGEIDDSFLDPILECLSKFEVQLKRLAFETYILEDINLFNAVFSSPTFAVCEVRLWCVDFPKFKSHSDFHILDELLSKPFLKVFEFSGIHGVGLKSELKAITNALTKQALVGTLESFIYSKGNKQFIGIRGVHKFIRALLRLP